MSRVVRCSIIQASNAVPATEPLAVQKQAMVEKHVGLIRQAAGAGAQIVCLQEIFNGPYFCAEQSVKWYETTEPVPGGPTVALMQSLAKELRIAMVVPVYEVEQEGIFYNTAAVIHNDGAYLGKYRKTHIPHVAPGFWEKFYFRPGNLGYPVFDLGFVKIGDVHPGHRPPARDRAAFRGLGHRGRRGGADDGRPGQRAHGGPGRRVGALRDWGRTPANSGAVGRGGVMETASRWGPEHGHLGRGASLRTERGRRSGDAGHRDRPRLRRTPLASRGHQPRPGGGTHAHTHTHTHTHTPRDVWSHANEAEAISAIAADVAPDLERPAPSQSPSPTPRPNW